MDDPSTAPLSPPAAPPSPPAAPQRHLGKWLPEIWALAHRRLQPQVKILLLSALVGVVAGAGAILFYTACQWIAHYSLALLAGYEQAAPGGEVPLFPPTTRPFIPLLLIALPALGGLLSGIIVYTLAPEAEGHGTDAAIEAYHRHGGVIRFRVPLIKIVASALTLGSGGSGGRDGPIAQIGAGFGALMARLLRLPVRERRVLMAAGMGAGIGAIFRAPLAGALFAAEVLYRSADFESEVVIPAALASVVAYCVFGLAFGWNSLFSAPDGFLAALTFDNPWHLLGYTILVPFVVLLALAYTRSFYGATHLFKQLPLRPHLRPMLGALITGALAVAAYYLLRLTLPRTVDARESLAMLSFGYGILQHALTIDPAWEASRAFAVLLLVVALGKILTTSLTIGSGGSGGVFGPSMVIGGCGGGALGILLHTSWPWLAPHPAAFVIVGMAGFFSAAAKTPFSTLIIVSEMTGSYNLLLPALWVCTLAFLLADEQSIYHAQVDSPARSPAHQGDFVQTMLRGLTVEQFIKPGQMIPVLHLDDALLEVIDRLSSSSYQALPVVDRADHFLGMINLDDVHLASQSPSLHKFVLAVDLMRTHVEPLRPSCPLDRAVELFVENDLDALPVLDGSKKVVALVRRTDIARAYLQRVHGPKEMVAVQ